jgi:hypothetical protein
MKTASDPRKRMTARRSLGVLTMSLLALWHSGVSQSAENIPWYQIEIIVFQHDQDHYGSESWPPVQATSRQGSTAIRLKSGGGQETRTEDYARLPASSRQLNHLASRLKNNENYHVLTHVAWRQPVRNRSSSIPVTIRGGERYQNEYELSGQVTLAVQRYLHLKADLAFRVFEPRRQDQVPFQQNADRTRYEVSDLVEGKPLPEQFKDPMLPDYVIARNFILKESRKMRSKEIHYIDSPVIGLIIQCTPYKPPVN